MGPVSVGVGYLWYEGFSLDHADGTIGGAKPDRMIVLKLYPYLFLSLKYKYDMNTN